jgi:hypothetical protein
MSKPYRLPVPSKIRAGFEKLKMLNVVEIDVLDFIMNYAKALPHSYTINLVKTIAKEYGYVYLHGKLVRVES